MEEKGHSLTAPPVVNPTAPVAPAASAGATPSPNPSASGSDSPGAPVTSGFEIASSIINLATGNINIEEEMKNFMLKNSAYGMIYYIWFIWLVQTYGLLVMMLNLLVSILGSSYEEAQTEASAMKYQFRSEMIVEAATLKQFFTFFLSPIRAKVFVLQYNILEEDDDDTMGQTKAITNLINTENKKMKMQMTQLSSLISD